MIYIMLTSVTLEQFPTEVRATSANLCMCIGLLGGVGLPFFNELGNELMILMLLLFASAAFGCFLLRETKQEEALKNMYSEIIRSQRTEELPLRHERDPH
jgi:hypothetical protein